MAAILDFETGAISQIVRYIKGNECAKIHAFNPMCTIFHKSAGLYPLATRERMIHTHFIFISIFFLT